MYNSEALQEKWQPVLNHPDLPQITDSYKRAVTAVILENQEKEMREQRSMLNEAEMSTADAVSNWDPVLISLVRRAMPNLMAYDICGVQPMSGPTGLIFAMKARMGEGAVGTAEALHDEADTGSSNSTLGAQAGTEPGALNGGTASVTTDAAIPDIWGVEILLVHITYRVLILQLLLKVMMTLVEMHSKTWVLPLKNRQLQQGLVPCVLRTQWNSHKT